MTSKDGIVWNPVKVELTIWNSITFGNNLFVATSIYGDKRVMYSSDGVTWNYASASEANPWYMVTYGDGLFISTSYSGINRSMYSTDAITWTSLPAGDGAWFGITYGNDKFVAVAQSGTNQVMTAECVKP